MLTGKNVFAYPAKKMGLVDEVVHHSKLHRAAKGIIKKINTGKFQRKKVKKPFISKILDHTVIGRSVVFSQAKRKYLK